MTDLTLTEAHYLDILLSFCEEYECNLIIKSPDTSNDDKSWSLVLIGRSLGDLVESGHLKDNMMYEFIHAERVELFRGATSFCSKYRDSHLTDWLQKLKDIT